MWTSQVKVGDRDVIDSGFVTTYKDEPIEITLGIRGSDNSAGIEGLSFIFNFVDDGEDPDVETKILSDDTVEFTIYNHRSGGVVVGGSTPPVGPDEPLSIGSLLGRKLFMIYQVVGRGGKENPKTTNFYYNFYLGGTVDE